MLGSKASKAGTTRQLGSKVVPAGVKRCNATHMYMYVYMLGIKASNAGQ
jgi:hypothetical protein